MKIINTLLKLFDPNHKMNFEYTDTFFSAKGIYQQLNPSLNSELSINIEKCVTSTNTILREQAKNGGKHGIVLIAEQQTDGRGRMGKTFFSPSGSGIYLSILLRPEIPAQEALFLTTSAAVAMARAIETVSDKKAAIKWVNDIYIDNKKVCGILTESALNPDTGKLTYAIVGIGINVCPPQNGFPSDIVNTATSVFDTMAVSADKNNILIGKFLNYFMEYYNNLDSKNFISEYINRSIIVGKRIIIIDKNTTHEAIALKIDRQCRLLVRFNDGHECWLNSGDVSIKIN